MTPEPLGRGVASGRFALCYLISVGLFTVCGVIAALMSKPLIPDLGAAFGGCLGVMTGVPVGVVVSFAIHRKHMAWASALVYMPAFTSAFGWVVLTRGRMAPDLAGAVCAGVAITMSLVAKFSLSDLPTLSDWACESCGYDLRGSLAAQCPECGNTQKLPQTKAPESTAHPPAATASTDILKP